MGWKPDHRRMKRPIADAPNAAEKRHMDRVAKLPGLVTGRSPVTLHHVTGYADRKGRIARSHKRIVPLEAEYHLIQNGPRWSVEALGHQGFFRVHGIDLLAEADRLWAESVEIEQQRRAA